MKNIEPHPKKTTTVTINVADCDLSYTNDMKGYMKAFNVVYNSFKELEDNFIT